MSEHEPQEAADVASVIDDNPEALAESLETLVRLQESGTMDDLAAFADTVALMSAAMDDEMVQTLAATGSRLGEVADTAADDDVAAGLETALSAVGDAQNADPERVGPIGLLKAMRDPEVQAGLGFILALARALGQDRIEAAEGR
ncbi:DUF1641 domain-containing protein [Halobacteriales archaeon Cl-PHB]